MALEQLSLAPTSVNGENDGVNNGVQHRPPSNDGGDDGLKAPRLPRWTRQEILVLIQGKRVAENRVRRGRAAGMAYGSGQVEPKWASVSSYCKRHGVNRGPVQCRKRWSNLAGDFKKIKEWETQQARDGTESFWVMRNDLRRERKLPGFFDREVYDILDGVTTDPSAAATAEDTATTTAAVGGRLALALAPTEESGEDTEAVFDSGRSAAVEDGLFSDFEQEEIGASPVTEATIATAAKEAKPISATMPISEKHYQPNILQGSQGQETYNVFHLHTKNPGSSLEIEAQREARNRTKNEKQPVSENPEIGSTSQEGRKRKRLSADGDEEMSNLQLQLIDVLQKNGKMLTAQLEAQNSNFELDREQRKDNADNLVAVLNKLADALGRIADKL
ncbi:trihelix transcription factor ASR3 isoform X1 [Pistacia vera]|uniref:trihelix transcription factor ASR3 isoform X1 n=1 Tax=Pistacia vera TaxID=55513 RepID=UPI00126363E8|nr:trihelix transcription factor ASR3 isoform X1 [Pistacia vera]